MEQTTSFATSINRFFKIQERLKQEMSEKQDDFRTSTSLSLRNPVPSQINETRFEELRQQSRGYLEAYKLASDLYLTIRQAVGAASATTNSLLAELNMLKARESMLAGVLRMAADPAAIGLDSLAEFKKDLLENKEAPSNGFGQNMVQISLLDKSDRGQLQAEIEKMRLRSFAIQEAIADANQAKVSIEVTESERALLNRLIGQG